MTRTGSSVRTSHLAPGVILVCGGGLATALNAAFTLVFIREEGFPKYSVAAPLLGLGTIAAAVAIGIEYAVTISIVKSGSLSQAIRQTYLMVVCAAPLFLVAPGVQSFLRLTTITPCLLGIALFILTFAASIPNAMLLAYGRIWSLAVIGVGESLVRLLLFVPFIHLLPIDAAIALSVFVTSVGGIAMVVVARAKGPKVPIIDQGIRSSSIGSWAPNSLIGFGLFLPFVIPLWTARDLLTSTVAGTISIAGFLAAGALFLAAPVASSMVPRSAAGIDSASLRRASLLCLAVASITSLSAWALGPILIPALVNRSAAGLRVPLGLMSLAVPGWAVIGYWAWIGVSKGNTFARYLVSLFSGIVAQVVFAFAVPKSIGAESGPLVSLSICFLVLLATHRGHSGLLSSDEDQLKRGS